MWRPALAPMYWWRSTARSRQSLRVLAARSRHRGRADAMPIQQAETRDSPRHGGLTTTGVTRTRTAPWPAGHGRPRPQGGTTRRISCCQAYGSEDCPAARRQARDRRRPPALTVRPHPARAAHEGRPAPEGCWFMDDGGAPVSCRQQPRAGGRRRTWIAATVDLVERRQAPANAEESLSARSWEYRAQTGATSRSRTTSASPIRRGQPEQAGRRYRDDDRQHGGAAGGR